MPPLGPMFPVKPGGSFVNPIGVINTSAIFGAIDLTTVGCPADAATAIVMCTLQFETGSEVFAPGDALEADLFLNGEDKATHFHLDWAGPFGATFTFDNAFVTGSGVGIQGFAQPGLPFLNFVTITFVGGVGQEPSSTNYSLIVNTQIGGFNGGTYFPTFYLLSHG